MIEHSGTIYPPHYWTDPSGNVWMTCSCLTVCEEDWEGRVVTPTLVKRRYVCPACHTSWQFALSAIPQQAVVECMCCDQTIALDDFAEHLSNGCS